MGRDVTDQLQSRALGSTSLRVTSLCMGGSVLGSMPRIFGYEFTEEQAIRTLRELFASPINFLDTAAGYSAGESERRIGIAIQECGGLPPGFVLATKADRDPDTGDFSGDQVRRCLDESLRRLRLGRIPLYYLHDPEHISFREAMSENGPVEAICRLKEQGLVEYIGVAGGPVELLARYAETGLFDVILTHNRYTLVDQSAATLLDLAQRRGIGIVNAAPFGGGILAKGTTHTDRYAYRPAPVEMLARIRAIEALCGQAGVELAAVALQYSMRDTRIGATVVGMPSPERVGEALRLASVPIAPHVWETLALLAPRPQPDGHSPAIPSPTPGNQ
jgi:D-threo-aldose 1-dehydrogenase